MHVTGRVGSQKHDRPPKIVGFTPATGWNPARDALAPGRPGPKGFGVVGRDLARRNGVHVYALPGPLVGKRFDQTPNGSFTGRIARHCDAALKRQQRGRKDYLALAPRQHIPAKFAGQDERRRLVDGNDLVPILVRMLGGWLPQDRPGIVDHNVDYRMRLFYLCDEGVEGGPVAEIGLIRPKPATPRFNGLSYRAALGFQRGRYADDVSPNFG